MQTKQKIKTVKAGKYEFKIIRSCDKCGAEQNNPHIMKIFFGNQTKKNGMYRESFGFRFCDNCIKGVIDEIKSFDWTKRTLRYERVMPTKTSAKE